jgi:hypothetical protein
MRYIPSPITPQFELMYSATANKSGRMQYHRIKPGLSKVRISRSEFIKAYNSLRILGMKPLPVPGSETDFQIEFYV